MKKNRKLKRILMGILNVSLCMFMSYVTWNIYNKISVDWKYTVTFIMGGVTASVSMLLYQKDID